MNILEVVNHFNETSPTGEDMLNFIRENMNDEELASALLFTVEKVCNNPFGLMGHEVQMILTTVALVMSERLLPDVVVFDEEFKSIIRNIEDGEDHA